MISDFFSVPVRLAIHTTWDSVEFSSAFICLTNCTPPYPDVETLSVQPTDMPGCDYILSIYAEPVPQNLEVSHRSDIKYFC